MDEPFPEAHFPKIARKRYACKQECWSTLMRLLNKKNYCLLPLLVKSAVLFAHEAEFRLQDSDRVSLNNTQLLSVEEGSIEYQDERVGLPLNDTSSTYLTLAVTSELAFFWNDYYLFDLASDAAEQVWVLSTDCDSFGIPKTLKLQPYHWLVVPSERCLKSQKGKRWQLTSVVFKPQLSASTRKETTTYDFLGHLFGKSKWFRGMVGSNSIGGLDSWLALGYSPEIDSSWGREQLIQTMPEYFQIFVLNTPIEGGRVGQIERLMNQIVNSADSIEELYRMLKQLLGDNFRDSLKEFKQSIDYKKGDKVITRWVLDYIRHIVGIHYCTSSGKQDAAAKPDEPREGAVQTFLEELQRLQTQRDEQKDDDTAPPKERAVDAGVVLSNLDVFWQEASTITAAVANPDALKLMAALAEAVNVDELINYVQRMLKKQGYFFSSKQLRQYILDSFREVTPLDLFRFIRIIPNYAAQISHDFYHLLGANPRLLLALIGMGIKYPSREINRFHHHEEQEARRRNDRQHKPHIKEKRRSKDS